MFQAILRSRKTTFVSVEKSAATRRNPKGVFNRTDGVEVSISLDDVISGGHEVYVGVNRRPTKLLARFIRDYYAKGGDLSSLYLFANNEEAGDNWPMRRACEGPTMGVCRSLVESLVGLPVGGRVWPDATHPAVCATGYLVLNGGDRASANVVVNALGDIRYAASKAKDFGLSAAAIANQVWPVGSPNEAFCTSVSLELANAVVRYSQGNKNLTTFCDHLLAATLGRGTYVRRPGLFASDMIDCYGEFKIGIAAAGVAALKLVVTSWASSEFHSDIFDDSVFSDCDPDGKFHAKFKQFCGQ